MSFLEVYFGSTSNHSTKRLVVLANGREVYGSLWKVKKRMAVFTFDVLQLW